MSRALFACLGLIGVVSVAKKKGGRPSRYDELGITRKLKSITGWAKHGSTNAEIAKMLGVSSTTLYEWKNKYPDFAEAIRAGAHEANGVILHAAFDQAAGFYATQREIVKLKKIAYEEISGEIIRDARGSPVLEDVEKVVEYDKYFPPDARMTMFMLVNRLSDHYKQKVASESKMDANITYVFDDEGKEYME